MEIIRDLIRRKVTPDQPKTKDEAELDSVFRLRMDYRRLIYRHKVNKYSGRITLIVNEAQYKFDKHMGWKGVAAGGLEIISTPGDHWTRYTHHGKEFAERLLTLLERAQGNGVGTKQTSSRRKRSPGCHVTCRKLAARFQCKALTDWGIRLPGPPVHSLRGFRPLNLIGMHPCVFFVSLTQAQALRSFRGWPDALTEKIELRVAQLPGRGSRLREGRFEQMKPLAETLAKALHPLLDRPFAFFGHSLGVLVAFEVARNLRARGFVPQHLFVSR